MKQSEWVPCPKCGSPHFVKVYSNTILVNFPAYCKRCKKEVNISTRAKEPEVKPACS